MTLFQCHLTQQLQFVFGHDGVLLLVDKYHGLELLLLGGGGRISRGGAADFPAGANLAVLFVAGNGAAENRRDNKGHDKKETAKEANAEYLGT